MAFSLPLPSSFLKLPTVFLRTVPTKTNAFCAVDHFAGKKTIETVTGIQKENLGYHAFSEIVKRHLEKNVIHYFIYFKTF